MFNLQASLSSGLISTGLPECHKLRFAHIESREECTFKIFWSDWLTGDNTVLSPTSQTMVGIPIESTVSRPNYFVTYSLLNILYLTKYKPRMRLINVHGLDNRATCLVRYNTYYYTKELPWLFYPINPMNPINPINLIYLIYLISLICPITRIPIYLYTTMQTCKDRMLVPGRGQQWILIR